MEVAINSTNIRKLFQLIRSTGSQIIGVSETIPENDGALITNNERRMYRCTEHFHEQFNPLSTDGNSSYHLKQEVDCSVAPVGTFSHHQCALIKRRLASDP